MRTFKKVLSLILAGSFILALASCQPAQTTKAEDILTVADNYAKCVQYLDSQRILDNTEHVDEGLASIFSNRLNYVNIDRDQAEVQQKIAKTITYTVDAESLVIEDDSATINITFTVVNYPLAFDGLVGFKDKYLKAIDDCTDKLEYTVKIRFNKQEDGKFLATEDTISKISELYQFVNQQFEFGPDTKDLVTSTTWLFGNNRVYENTRYIELDVWFDENPKTFVYYTVSKDGTEIYKSGVQPCVDVVYRAPYGKSQGVELDDKKRMAPGEYSISVFRDDGTLLIEDKTTVSVNDEKEVKLVTKTPKNAQYEIKDASFAAIASLGWWDYQGTMVKDGTYCSNTNVLAFSIKLLSDAPEVYYAYYFVPGNKVDLKKIDYSKPIYESTIEQFVYLDSTSFYNFDYSSDDALEIGYYVLVIAKDKDSVKNPYIIAKCRVIPESSEDFA